MARSRTSEPASSQQRPGRAVWAGRILFITCLLLVAIALGYFSHYFLTNAERQLAIAQYASLTNRALTEIQAALHQKRVSLISMSTFASEINPSAKDWPFVSIDNYVQIAKDFLDATGGKSLGIAPLVKPEHVPDFEAFATELYHRDFGNATPAMIWATDNEGKSNRRHHDVTGNATWGSPNQVAMP